MTRTVERRVYRGRSLDELLEQIRDELGPNAVVTRQRDGVVGGIGGFFGRRLVEVEAELQVPGGQGTVAVDAADALGSTGSRHGGGFEGRREPLDGPPVTPAMPPRSVLDAYDAGGQISPAEALAESPLLAPLLEQSSPFTEHLAAADRRLADVLANDPRLGLGLLRPPGGVTEAAAPEPATNGVHHQEHALAEVAIDPVASAPAWAQPDLLLPRAGTRGRRGRGERAALRLAEAGFPGELALAIVEEAERHVRPFGATEPFSHAVRRTLARRIPVEYGWSGERRTIALVGGPGTGKTTAAAKIANAYLATGQVACLELLPHGHQPRLAGLVGDTRARHAAAATPVEAIRALRLLADAGLVVVDTPGVGPFDVEGRQQLADWLEAIAPDEVHLVVPSTAAPTAVAMEFEALAGASRPTRLLISNLDAQGPLGGALGLALAHGLAVSYLGSGREPGCGLRPADAAELAALVVPDLEQAAA